MKFISSNGKYSAQGRPAKHRRTMPWIVAILLGLVLTALISGTTLLIQQGSVVDLVRGFLTQPLLFVLNGLPIGLTLLLFTALFGNLFHGAALTTVLWNGLSLVNLIKCESRSDPFVPADIFLIREAMGAVAEYQMDLHLGLWLMTGLMALAFVLLGLLVKTPRIHWIGRIALALVAAGGFAGSVVKVYTDKDLYNSFTVSYRYNIAAVFNELGFPYCFLYNCNLYPVEKPADYSKQEAAAWAADTAEPGQPKRANVILIMGEAFSDLSEEAAFAYTEADDPMASFKALADQPNAISGHIVVSNFGAGTANTEFDVMTGMRTSMIAENATSAFRVIRRQTNSLAWVCRDQGYETYFMHPGEDWFYNRTSVYHHLGIDDQVFLDAFGPEDYKGTMISDEAFRQQLEADLTVRLAEDAPLFAYTVTIQNHQAYPYSKYGFEPTPAPVEGVTLSDASVETLSVYMEGVRDTADMLAEVADFLDQTQEPTLLVFFGDHRPNLGQDYSVYKELGTAIGSTDTLEQTVDNISTPYLIWANDAYCEAYGVTDLEDQVALPRDNLISDCYLGSLVYDLLDMTGQDAYYDFLHDLRQQVPVLCQDTYRLADGTYTQALPEAEAAQVEKMHRWVYYRLKDEPVR